MPRAGTVSVACTLSDHLAFRRVADCIRREGGRALASTRADVLAATAGGGVGALVYDLEPADASAADLVRQIHGARPDWPVWLYYAPRVGVIEAVADVASLRGVWATPQGIGSLHDGEIRPHIRRLVRSMPRVQLLHLLGSILRPLPTEVREYLEVSLEHRDHAGPRSFRVRNGAANLPAKLRHLERMCKAATGLGPKRLLDHLVLAFLTFKGLAFDIPVARAAEQAGLSLKDLDRLRHRVLATDAESVALEPRAQFEYALIALTMVCRAPREAAGEIVQQIVRERLA